MSYTGSAGQIGNQFTLGVGSTPVSIGEVVSFGMSGQQMKTVDSTNLQSLSEEFIRTLLAPGGVDLVMNRLGSDAAQTTLRTDFYAGTIASFTAQAPKTAAQTTSGDKIVFTALVEEFSEFSSVEAEKIIQTKVKLKVQGGASATPFTFTAGS